MSDVNEIKMKLYTDLSSIRFTQFNKRRDFEFLINFSIWTILAIIIVCESDVHVCRQC